MNHEIILSRIRNLFFTFLLTLILFPCSCSAQPQDSSTYVEITHKGIKKTFQLPFTYQDAAVGDTILIKALGRFQAWSGDLASFGSENPLQLVVTKPMEITIDYFQIAGFTVSLKDALFINKKTLEFDVWISLPDSLTISAYQIAIQYNPLIRGNGTLSFEYVPNTTWSNLLQKLPTSGVGVNTTENKFHFGSNPTTIKLPPVQEARIGKFRVRNTVDFASFNPALNLNHTGGAITNIFLGHNLSTDITSFARFTNLTESIKASLIFQ